MDCAPNTPKTGRPAAATTARACSALTSRGPLAKITPSQVAPLAAAIRASSGRVSPQILISAATPRDLRECARKRAGLGRRGERRPDQYAIGARLGGALDIGHGVHAAFGDRNPVS